MTADPNPSPTSGRGSISSGVVAAVLARSGTFAASILASSILARVLSPPELAAYRSVLLVHTTLTALCMVGLPWTPYFFLRRTAAAERPGFLARTMLLLVAGGCMEAVILMGWSSWPGAHEAYVRLLRYAVPIALFSVPALLVEIYLITERRPRAQLLCGLAFALLQSALTVGFGIGFRSARAALIGASIAALLQFVIAWRMIFGFAWLRPQWGGLRAQLAYSFSVFGVDAVNMINLQLDKLLVLARLSPDQFVIYSLGAVELPIADLIGGSAFRVLFPELTTAYTENNYDRVFFLWHEGVRRLALTTLPITVAMFATAPEIVSVLFSARYLAATSVFQIFIFLTPLRLISVHTVLHSIGRPRDILIVRAIGSAVRLPMMLLAIGPLGLLGPALVTLATSYLEMLVLAAVLGVHLRQPFHRVLPWSMLARFALACVPAYFFSQFACRMYPLGRFPTMIVAGAASTIAFGACSLLLKILSWSDVRTMQAFVSRALTRRAARVG